MENTPNGPPLEGAKALSDCFLLLLFQSAHHAEHTPQGDAPLGRSALGYVLLPRWGVFIATNKKSLKARGALQGNYYEFVILDQGYIQCFTFFAHLFGPNTCLNFTDVRLAEVEHTEA